MRHILFGDSIGFGVGDYENGGWATQLRLFIDRQKQSKDHTLINLSVSGDTARHLLLRMEQEAKLRMRQNTPEEFTFLLAVGANDSKIDMDHSENNIEIDEYERKMRTLIDAASSLSKEVILIGLVPVDESRTTPYKENKHYTVKQLRQYNQVLLRLADEYQLRHVDFFDQWMKMDLTQLFADGLHPNTRGHQLMFETIKNQLFMVGK